MRTLALLVLAGACVATAARASAQPAPATEPSAELRAQARAKSELGRRHYELGDYHASIDAYRSAYLLLPSPGVLFNLGQAYRMGGECAAAARAYRSFLRSEPSGAARDLATEQLPAVETCAASDADAAAQRGRRMRRGGVITAAVGVAALGAAGYFALDASRAEDEVEAHSRRGGRWDQIADANARGERSSTLGLGFAIGGGAVVTAGVVMYLLGSRDQSSESAARLWVTPGRTATVVGTTWQF